MSAVIAIHVDGLFVDTSYDIPNCEPDANALRWYGNLADGSKEQLLISCDSPKTDIVDQWLRSFGLKYSLVHHLSEERERERMKELVRFVAAQQSKIVLFIGGRFMDCNNMADLGYPTLRYMPPAPRGLWEFDPRDSWGAAVARQGGE